MKSMNPISVTRITRLKKVWFKQQYLNDVLTNIRPHAEIKKFDDGTNFPSAREYNKLTQEQKEAKQHPVSIEMQVDGKEILLGDSIASKVNRL